MKKLMLIAVFAGVATIASAQFKPEAGQKTLETKLAPLGGTPLSIDGIRLRMFNDATTAYRLGLNLNYSNSKSRTGTTADGSTELYDKNSALGISLSPGIEKHMAGTNRLSPYMGAELNIGFRTTTEVSEFESTTTANKVEEQTIKGNGGFFSVGANVVAGADYYISSKLYMGVELSYGLNLVNSATIKEETTVAGAPTVKDQKPGNSFNFSPGVMGQFRIGYAF
jgi:hypothetical protein